MTARHLLTLLVLALGLGTATAKREKRAVVKLETNMGIIRVALFDETPLHSGNFAKLAEEGFYDGLLFHRVIEDFMIQAGDPTSRGAEPGAPLGEGNNGYIIPPEIDLPFIYHWRGTLAAAREPDEVNPEQYSSGCQFYIVWGKKWNPAPLEKVQYDLAMKGIGLTKQMTDDYEQRGGCPHLDGQYTVFGEVIEGLDIVKRIQAVPTDERDRPTEDVVIVKAQVEQQSQAQPQPKQKPKRR